MLQYRRGRSCASECPSPLATNLARNAAWLTCKYARDKPRRKRPTRTHERQEGTGSCRCMAGFELERARTMTAVCVYYSNHVDLREMPRPVGTRLTRSLAR